MRVRFGILALTLAMAGCGGDTPVDAGSEMDSSTLPDSGMVDEDAGTDAGFDAGTDAGTDAGVDAGTVDAGPICMGGMVAACMDGALECLCCPLGGPAMSCLCTTRCSADVECTDPARPFCNRPGAAGGVAPGICTPMGFTCNWGAICAAPDTPIATPEGERPIAELGVGDLVFTMHEGELVARPLRQIGSTPAVDHAVVRVTLESGVSLFISGGHPTADGRTFDALAPGGQLDGTRILEVATVPYEHAFTHDILPDSDSGTYVAGGVLIGSTLTPPMDR